MCKLQIILVLAVVLKDIYFCEAVPFLTKCNIEDSKCITKSGNVALPKIALGLPEYNVKTVDPFFVAAANLFSPHLKLILTDLTITGLQDLVIKNVKIEKANSRLVLKIVCNLHLEGQYVMDGKLLFLPLEAKGPVHVMFICYKILCK